MPSLSPVMELDHHPTSKELGEAMSKLKRRQAGGRTGILPELLLHGSAELQDRLLLVMDDVWKRGKVVKGWQHAKIVPIPKKGDLR